MDIVPNDSRKKVLLNLFKISFKPFLHLARKVYLKALSLLVIIMLKDLPMVQIDDVYVIVVTVTCLRVDHCPALELKKDLLEFGQQY